MSSLLSKWTSSVETFEQKHGSKAGYFYAFIANALFAIHDYGIKAASQVPTFQLMFYRGIVIIIFGFTYVKVLKTPIQYKSSSVTRMFISRAFIGILTMFFVFYGFQRAELSEAIALFQILPVASAILGYLILRETFDIIQGVVVMLSIIGAFMILKPGFLYSENQGDTDAMDYGILGKLSVIASAITCALSIILARKMVTQKVDPQVSSCYFGPILCMVVSIGMVTQGIKEVISKDEIVSILLICSLGFISNYFNMRAVKHADAGKVALMSYAEIPFGYVLDVAFFGTELDEWSSFGVCLIFSCLFVQVFKSQIFDLFKKKDQEVKEEIL